ncbi:LuxR family transcriptional regulator [Dactylosporangium fulvum]|uniref:AAA family ATPase n=1 Tax=Dactylosporangium fulvum TaxID=53359 RepID=A0ABY5VZJ3_9ACTN|nr:AAA family ATPase [Dactylosporangium fulvum]UWP83228.1 AAA family ATPase [Dactylosporangium fulvum]
MSVDLTAPFIGRQGELRLLRGRLVAAGGTGGSAAVVVAAEAGVGKSRLIGEFTATATQELKAHVLAGSCVNLGGTSIPYAPLVDAIRRLVRERGSQYLSKYGGAAYTDLTRLITGLPGVDSGPDTGPVAQPDAQMRVFAAVLRMLDHLGGHAPTVLVFEDLHWADPETLDLVSYLVQAQTDERLLLVLTFRPSDAPTGSPLRKRMAEPAFARRVHRIDLAPFDLDEFGRFLRATVGHDVDAEIVERYHELTAGNAFFAEELLAGRQLSDPADVPLPDSLRELMRERLNVLDERGTATMQAAAAAGREVGYDLLAAVSELQPRSLDDALRQCVEYQMLRAEKLERLYAFRHALLRQVAYDETGLGVRRELHRKLAEALIADPDLGPAGELTPLLAHHWYEARDWPEAMSAAATAAREAERNRAFRVAYRQYQRVLELWPKVRDAERRVGMPFDRLLATAAEAARWAGDLDAGLELLNRALAHVAGAAQPVRRGELLERLGSYLWEAGEIDASTDAYREADALLPEQPPTAVKARVIAALATAEVRAGEYVDGRERALSAVRHARSAGARAEEGRALNTAGVAQTMLDDPEGVMNLRSAVAIAKEVDHLEDLHRAYGNLTVALEHAGRLDESIDVARQELDRLKSLRLPRTKGARVLANNASAALVMLGRWDEAEQLLSADVRDRPPREMRYARLTLAEIFVARGRFDEADEMLEPLLTDAAGADPRFLSPLAACRAELALWRADPAAARRAVQEGLAAVRGTQHTLSLLRLCATGLWAAADEALRRAAGGAASADGHLADLGHLIDGVAEPEAGTEPHAWREQCRAELARAADRDGAAQWAAVAQAWQQLRRPYQAAYAHWRRAEAAVRDDRKADAADGAREAHRLAGDLGAQPLTGAVEGTAHRHGLDLTGEHTSDVPAVPKPRAPFDLTPREVEVFQLLCDGLTNRGIGAALGMSERTAGVHVSNILRKLGVDNRNKAIAAAHRLQLFGDS